MRKMSDKLPASADTAKGRRAPQAVLLNKGKIPPIADPHDPALRYLPCLFGNIPLFYQSTND